MNLLRLVGLLLALPGQLLLAGLNRLGGPPPPGRPLQMLEGPVRWSVHAFVWVFAVVTVLVATASPTARAVPAPAPAAVPVVVRTAPTTVPTPVSTAPSTAVEEPVYVPLPDDEDDGESRFCRRRWWC